MALEICYYCLAKLCVFFLTGVFLPSIRSSETRKQVKNHWSVERLAETVVASPLHAPVHP